MRAKQWVVAGVWGVMTFSALGASANEKNEKNSSCQADVEAFCAGVEPGDGRIRKCLKQHKEEISSECRDQLATGTRKSPDKKEVGTRDVVREEASAEEGSTEAAVAPEESQPEQLSSDSGSGSDSNSGSGFDSSTNYDPDSSSDSYAYPSPQ